jgi:plasmid stabilization system protein ParE
MSKYKLRLTEKAEKEYIDAFVYYEDKQSGLGIRFEREL